MTKNKKLGQVFLSLFVLIGAFMQVLTVHAAPLTLDLTPLTTVVGDTVVATGSRATENGEVRLYIGSVMIVSTTADETGSYSARFTIPAVGGGSQMIIALDVVSGFVASASLTVEPRISVAPAFGSFNDEISVRGIGFTPYECVTLWFEGIDVTPSSAPATDYFGTFETSFIMPSMPNGTYTFNVEDKWGKTAKTSIHVVPRIFLQPTSGAANTFVWVYGFGFSASAEVTLFFDSIDVTQYGSLLTTSEGSFSTAFFVPSVPDGIYSVRACDNMTIAAMSDFAVPSPVLKLTPSTISESSIITVEGVGLQPEAPVILCIEDIVTTSVFDLMVGTESIIPKPDGSFRYTFMVPITEEGVYDITAYQAFGSSPSDLRKVASAGLTIVKRASLDAEIEASTMHFRGELAEFYLRTSLEGELVDVHIDNVLLCFANASSEQDLTSSIVHISTGFYRIPYAIPDDAPFGTYALLVEATLHSSLIEASGSATGSFAISPFFTAQAASLLDVQNNIATVIIPDLGTVKANLSTINAKLDSIEGNIATIQSDIGTLQTKVDVIDATLVSIKNKLATVQSSLGTLETSVDAINVTLVSIDGDTATIRSDLGTISTSTDAIHAKVTSIDGDVATVSSDIGTVKVRVAESGNQTSAATLFAVAATIAASASAVILYRRRPPGSPAPPSASPPAEKPLTQSAPEPTEPDRQEQAQTQIQADKTEETSKPSESPPQEMPPPSTQAPQNTQTETTQETPALAEPPPQAQSPPDSTTPEAPPQTQPEPQAQPDAVVVPPEYPLPQ